MTKIKTGNQRKSNFTAQVYTFLETHLYGILALILVLGTVIFHPSFSSFLLGWQRDRVYQAFFQDVQAKQKIEPQAFWQFREFYSPGEFSFNPQSVGVYQTLRLSALPEAETLILRFTAPKLVSTDSIIDSPQPYFQKVTQVSRPLFQNDQSVIYQSGENEVSIVFYASIDEMMSANGFFDYLPSERELLQGKYWLNQTTVTRN